MKNGRPKEKAVEKLLRSPLRVRILGWLAAQPEPRTKREIGRALSLSNAAVHYHVKQLEEAGLAKLEGTRPGPNSITERLYSGKGVTGPPGGAMDDKERSEFYLRYTLDSMSEMHREGEALIRSDWESSRFLVGCYGAHATEKQITGFKKRLLKMLREFHEAHARPRKGTKPIAMTFGLMPSSGLAWGTTQKLFDMLS